MINLPALPVEFLEADRVRIGNGIALSAVTFDSVIGTLLWHVTIRQQRNGIADIRRIPGYMLSPRSYARVCWAVGIEP